MNELKNFVLEGLEAIEHWHEKQSEKFAEALLTEKEEHAKETLQILKEHSTFKYNKAREYIRQIMELQSDAEIIERIKMFEKVTG